MASRRAKLSHIKPTAIIPTEADILRTILDGLLAMQIWHVRMNTATTILSYKGKRRAIRQGRRGMADILALPNKCILTWEVAERVFTPLWIECKRLGEKQSEDQIAFEAEVEAQGHRYAVIHSWEELQKVLAQ
jgi:hypothetical protein